MIDVTADGVRLLNAKRIDDGVRSAVTSLPVVGTYLARAEVLGVNPYRGDVLVQAGEITLGATELNAEQAEWSYLVEGNKVEFVIDQLRFRRKN